MYKATSIILLAFGSLVSVTVGQIIQTGQCNPNIALVSNFNTQNFMGTWYEIQRLASTDQLSECASFSFTAATSGFTVQHSGVTNNFQQTSAGTATVTTGTAQISMNLPMFGGARDFWVLLTDYNDYAVTYACENISNTQRRIYLWVLGRQRTITAVTQTLINNQLNTLLGIQLTSLTTIDHGTMACTLLPVITPGQAIVIPGQCDTTIPAQANFNVANFMGTWHQISSYFSENSAGSCANAQYTAGTSGVSVVNSQIVNQALMTITGTATLSSTDSSGKLKVVLNVGNTQVEQELWVLATDYSNYAISYSCENVSGTTRRLYSWILSRQQTLSATAQTEVNRVIGTLLELNSAYYTATDQSATGCFYLPEPTGQPVQFPGQCDTTIPALANFDPTRYVGTWFDVESYPAPFQTGACNKAEYSLNTDGSVTVRNTQVVNQLLETWIGSAVLSSNDGSAKLEVTFNVNGVDVKSDYWVLNTDYTSYALVYSCQNIGTNSRLVYSWKLSRTNTLTAAATTAINTIINNIPVLNQQYYVAGRNTDADCFYYPDNNGGDVVLPGQCVADASVPAITNFNANTFAGAWYEVARYPGLQQAECVSSQFTLSGTTGFTVTYSSVSGERQTSSNVQTTIPTTGRGVISATINGVPFNNVYILGTDYSEYALLYACRNINTLTKQVYSWKLGRNRSGLSTSANTIINGLVSANIDLWEGYYRSTSQTDDACFHYPVFAQPPTYIELPGACPTNIRGVANFNANLYLGTWYETARYPTSEQVGQCSRAAYSLGQRVEVVNTEVVNQTLRTQTGFADVASTDGSGQLNVEFIVNGVTQTSNYYILATDYASYALVYSCVNTNNGLNSRVSSWKLSRTPTLSTQAAAAITPVILSTRGLIEEYYQSISQTDDACFYIPTLNTNEAPLFRGQCETITGVQGFDAQRYLGWWHEIQSYPVDGVRGECRSSQYSLDGTSYRVVDTQVQNNAATLLTGNVTVTTDGRLRRTMTGGTVQDIWVLATDYNSYALLYSCENVNSEYRRVWSAKHSKTRTLTTAAQNAMAAVITNNNVLHEQLYVNADQTDATCFHYPTVTQGQVIIPGQCDSQIPVVQNFNVNDFVGDWYYTERYDAVSGSSCIGSRFKVDGARNTGAISVLNYEVRNNELETVDGSARLTATDNSARFEVTLPVANSQATTTTTVFIMATDYTSYALGYSCVNVNAFQRQVRAWKMSRTRTMPAAGTTAINNLIQQRQELYQSYFNSIAQNDECPEPSSALIVKNSIIMLIVCALLQRLL